MNEDDSVVNWVLHRLAKLRLHFLCHSRSRCARARNPRLRSLPTSLFHPIP
jgi:hypothetical protein